jgi:hypothetical protein
MQALAAQNAAVTQIDMSEVSKGGAGRRLLPAGMAYGRLVRYIEFGNHKNEYQGQVKQPTPVVRIGFALWGDADPSNPGQEGNQYHTMKDGVAVPAILNSFDMKLGNNEKSKSKIAFDKLNYKGLAKNFAQFIGDAFLVPILVKKGTKADSKPYNEIDWKGILPPHCPMTKQPYGIPEAPEDAYQMFLWDSPTQEDWDSLFIDGQNDQGKSKNFLQAKCLEALNFRGSMLEQMLGGALPDFGGGVEGDEDPDEATPAAGNVPAVPNVPSVPAVPAVPSTLPDVPFDGGTPVVAPAVAPITAPAGLPNMPALPAVAGIPGL